jgi:hypothetical protein
MRPITTRRVCAAIIIAAVLALCWHGPIGQLAHARREAPGFVLFAAALVLTALGSSWYHLAPDNARLVWDRLPIALACAGLLSAAWQETAGLALPWLTTGLLALAAAGSVLWWRHTDLMGHDDLRWYLLWQVLPLVLIPILQACYLRPPRERLAFGLAIGCNVAAKALELNDHAVLAQLGWVSGHTLKHLLATVAAALLVGERATRPTSPMPATSGRWRTTPSASCLRWHWFRGRAG